MKPITKQYLLLLNYFLLKTPELASGNFVGQNKLTIATIAVMIKAITQRFSTFNNIFFCFNPTNVNILFKKYIFETQPYIFILIFNIYTFYT